ncbi:MAG TPA: FKBP-type peptidyl-prolyl cis-trans isomerase [Thermoanaerobaculia bacterium]|nr:FKBP-type peptidyl-prolyl cis-trans isomerase [Thermoanaerobaculia bacterium]
MRVQRVCAALVALGCALATVGAAPPPRWADAGSTVELSSGLRYRDLRPGRGAQVERGHLVTVHFEARLENGSQVVSTRERGAPVRFRVGASEVIAGLDRGVEGMRPGGRRLILVPPRLAYGERGAGPVPPGASLLFEVDLLEVR